MRKNQQLVIVLPESSEELPIRIVRGSRSMELRLCLCPPDGEERHINETCPERKYVFIWRQNDYLKTAVDEIQWIEAAGSYSRIHLTGGRSLVISFNLASVRRKLPESDFIRIHRSRIVNLRHVETLVGNSLKIGNELLAFCLGRFAICRRLPEPDCKSAATRQRNVANRVGRLMADREIFLMFAIGNNDYGQGGCHK